MTIPVPAAIDRAAWLVQPALRRAVDGIRDDRMRLIASYQLGWCDADGRPSASGGGKGIRSTLAVVSAEAGGGDAAQGVPAAVAVELIHNFSLLHDDVMDLDVERRHRPTGWVAFGTGPAILAGTAMLTLASEVLLASADGGASTLPCLLDATQQLISGQSDDILFENATVVDLAAVLRMEAGKTASLLACAASIGARAAGATPDVVAALAGYGHDLGMAFQLVDDVLGITGDPSVTGKSASSDVRSGKRSAPIVAALTAANDASLRLRELYLAGPLHGDEDVALAAKLVEDAGGIDWAERHADAYLTSALALLESVALPPGPARDLLDLGQYVVHRDR
jgi:geranylgeranyl diphosphate synthase type I